MSPANDDSRLIRQLYAGALQRDPEERNEYLARVCADNPALRAKVAALLSQHAKDFVDVATATGAVGTADNVAGRVVGPYVLIREIGRGGMGVVYLADDTRLSRQVALKALRPALGEDHAGRERLRLEARAAATISHPGVATVYALEIIEGELYLACEYVPGEPLRALLAAGPLPLSQVVGIAVQLTRALLAAHTLGVVHRDIKPENVIRTPSGVVKVLDFGLARIEGALSSSLTQTGVVLGTPAYLAPEQARGERADHRADLFALGVVIYELASGVNPFAAETVISIVARIVEEDPPPLSHVRPDSVPELDRIVATCLRKDPRERYQATDQLLHDLERIERQLNANPQFDSSRSLRPAPPTPRRPSRSWWVAHQVIVSAIFALMLYPDWRVRDWLTPPWGVFFLLAVLAVAAVTTSLRLHLLFVARFFPSEVPAQQAWAHSWTRWCDAVFCGLQIAAAVGIGAAHPEMAMLLVAVSASLLVGSFVIEPLTARMAFEASSSTAPW